METTVKYPSRQKLLTAVKTITIQTGNFDQPEFLVARKLRCFQFG